MVEIAFQKATRKKLKLRMALIGPSGSGKTFTALTLAQYLGKRVALIDTEGHSASKYAKDGDAKTGFVFDTLELDTFSPQTYTAAINAAAHAGYDVLIIDSLSHAWMGKEGALAQVDKAAQRERGNSFAAWRHVTPMHNELVDTMLRCPMHLLVTMRSKTEYILETVERDGRKTQVPRKVGMAPIQRDGIEFEVDITCDMDYENTLVVSKTRCPELTGAVIHKPGKELADTLRKWLDAGVDVPKPEPKPAPEPAPAPAAATPTATPLPEPKPKPARESDVLTADEQAAFKTKIDKLANDYFDVYAKVLADLYAPDLTTITSHKEAVKWYKAIAAACKVELAKTQT